MAKSKKHKRRIKARKEMENLLRFICSRPEFENPDFDFMKDRQNDVDSDEEFRNDEYQKITPVTNVYPLESFPVDIKEAEMFRKMILKCVEDSDEWNVPSIFILKGKRRCGKSSFIESLFENDDINVMVVRNMPVKGNIDTSNVDMIIVAHPDIDFNDTDFFSVLEGKVILIELDEDENFPIEDAAIMSLNLGELPLDIITGKVNEVLESYDAPKIEESDLVSEEKKHMAISLCTRDMLAHNLYIQKEFNLATPAEMKIIDEQKFFLRYPNPALNEETKDNPLLLAEYTKYFDIYCRLNKPARFLTMDSTRFSRVLALLDTHPNLKDKEGLLSSLKMAAFASCDNNIQLPPMLFVGPPGSGKTLLCQQLREILGQDNDVFIPMGSRGTDNLIGASPTYRDANSGEILSSVWMALNDECCLNPIIVLDELEKACFTNHSDVNQDVLPSLLQLLGDINMDGFRDAFFDVPLENFRPNFICTANSTDTIPEPLLDRFAEIIYFDEYTKKDFTEHIIPLQYKKFRSERKKGILPDELDPCDIEIIYEVCQGKTRRIKSAITRYFAARFDTQGNMHKLRAKQVEKLISNANNDYDKPQQIGFCR